jgi:hypothetical protein
MALPLLVGKTRTQHAGNRVHCIEISEHAFVVLAYQIPYAPDAVQDAGVVAIENRTYPRIALFGQLAGDIHAEMPLIGNIPFTPGTYQLLGLEIEVQRRGTPDDASGIDPIRQRA